MSKIKTHEEKTSAIHVLVAFDYQYYFFILRLLSLTSDETIGIEMKDDVHTQLNNSHQILMQVKHTINKKSDGYFENLTTLDLDLWKTLSNWAQIITDKASNRESETAQLSFIKKTDFLLVSNKSFDSNNSFIKALIEYKNNSILQDIKNKIFNIKKTTTDKNIIEKIETILTLNDNVLSEFLKKVGFELGASSIIDDCKDKLKSMMIPEQRIDYLFNMICSELKVEIYNKVIGGNAFSISFNDFYKRYKRLFEIARLEKKPIYKLDIKLPNNLSDQLFIKQLLHIGDLDQDDNEDIQRYTEQKLLLKNHIDLWVTKGELTLKEKNEFDGDTIEVWKNTFKRIHKKSKGKNEEVILENANSIVDILRDKNLLLGQEYLDTKLSNGQFYHLSDIPEIGWHINWNKIHK